MKPWRPKLKIASGGSTSLPRWLQGRGAGNGQPEGFVVTEISDEETDREGIGINSLSYGPTDLGFLTSRFPSPRPSPSGRGRIVLRQSCKSEFIHGREALGQSMTRPEGWTPNGAGDRKGIHLLTSVATGQRGTGGFTMIEIALCIAIIGFALVAIIGILPAGMQVQKDNREDTIINQDATYWMEAIRNGEQPIDDLVRYVDSIYTNNIQYTDPNPPLTGRKIIGKLCVPLVVDGTNWADVRAISGPASEKANDPNARDFSFRYRMQVEVREFRTSGFRDSADLPAIEDNLYEIRLFFKWPLVGDPAVPAKLRVGSNRQTVRVVVSARRERSADDLFFLRQ
jgi:type II secretory pathway pseudopilin PulG